MNTRQKVTAGVFIIVVLIIGGLWYFMQDSQTPSTNTEDQSTQSETDSADASIDQDLSGIDTQMADLNADLSSTDSSFNDQPISQAE